MKNSNIYFTVEAKSSGCVDYSHGSECCAIVGTIKFIKKTEDAVCLNMTFTENQTAIRFYLAWNEDVKMQGELIDFKDDICVTVPIPKVGNLVDMCIFFSKYSRVSI